MRNVLRTNDFSRLLKIRVLNCYVFSVPLYGVEAWALKKNDIDWLEAFEMWVYRKILRISWVSRTTNKEVLRRFEKEKKIIKAIKSGRTTISWPRVKRGKYTLLQTTIQKKSTAKYIQVEDVFISEFNRSPIKLFRLVTSKIKISTMIATFVKGGTWRRKDCFETYQYK